MKIVHVTGYFDPNVGYEETYLSLNQKELGHEVYVITTDRNPKIPGVKITELESEFEGVKIIRLPVIFGIKDFLVVKGMKKILKEIKPDVVHVHEPRQFISAMPAFYKDELKYKLIADQHDYDIFPTLKARLTTKLLRKPLCVYTFNKADKIISTNPEAKDFLISVYGIKKEIIESSLGADTEHFKFNEKKRKEIRDRLGIKDEVLIISAGHIGRIKRLEVLINAVSELKAKILILGGGDEEYIEELKKLSGETIFIDRIAQKELPYYYSAADIGVWPSRATITIVEAMSCRLPVIIPNRKVVNHFIKKGGGINFELDNINDLKEKINFLINNKKERNRLSKEARKTVEENFSYRKIAERLINIYNS